MKANKKVLALLLALALALSLLPTVARAADEIESLKVVFVRPEEGQTPNYSPKVETGHPEGSLLTAHAYIDWYDITAGRSLSESGGDVFQRGHSYRAIVWVIGNYEGTPLPAPEKMTFPAGYTSKTAGDKDVYMNRLRQKMYLEYDCLARLDEATVERDALLCMNKAGAHPNLKVKSMEPTLYEVTGVRYYPTASPSVTMGADSSFQRGVQYSADVTLHTLGANQFTSKIETYVGSEWAKCMGRAI